MKSIWYCAVWGLFMPMTVLTGAATGISAQDIAAAAPAPQVASPLFQLAWDSDHKEVIAKEADLTAEISFGVTNISDAEVVIDHVKASCLCTVAKLPIQPWHLAPHTDGHIGVTIDLKGKIGEFNKTLNVFFADKNAPPKVLRVKVKMPDRNIVRARNTELAKADRQAVFKGNCAKCHAEPVKTASGMALYREICGICHEAKPRATMVPDVRLIKDHPTDYAFWKAMIANGKPGTLMPAFALSQGGPLTDEQIDSLAKAIDAAFPYSRFSGRPTEPASSPVIQGQPIIRPIPSSPKN